MKKLKKQTRYTFFAIATRQPDGSWYPWVEVMKPTKEGVKEEYRRLYGKNFIESKKLGLMIKRFYVSTI